jgi:hypothetical protein
MALLNRKGIDYRYDAAVGYSNRLKKFLGSKYPWAKPMSHNSYFSKLTGRE